MSKVQPLVDLGAAVPIMTWGALNELGNIVRDPNFPDIPTFKEVYTHIKGHEPSGSDWSTWKAFFIALRKLDDKYLWLVDLCIEFIKQRGSVGI